MSRQRARMKRASSGVAIGPPWHRTMHVAVHGARRRRPGVDARHAVGERQRGVRADRAADRQAEVADDDVGACARHRRRVGFAEDVRRRQQVERARRADHLDLERRSPCRSPRGSRGTTPSMSPTVGKFCTPEKPIAASLAQEVVAQQERVGAVDAREHRRALARPAAPRAPSPSRCRSRCRRRAGRRASRGPPSGSGPSCR